VATICCFRDYRKLSVHLGFEFFQRHAVKVTRERTVVTGWSWPASDEHVNSG
jgi:hypothetical protein